MKTQDLERQFDADDVLRLKVINDISSIRTWVILTFCSISLISFSFAAIVIILIVQRVKL